MTSKDRPGEAGDGHEWLSGLVFYPALAACLSALAYIALLRD